MAKTVSYTVTPNWLGTRLGSRKLSSVSLPSHQRGQLRARDPHLLTYLGRIPHAVHHVLRAVVISGPPVQVELSQPVGSGERTPTQN